MPKISSFVDARVLSNPPSPPPPTHPHSDIPLLPYVMAAALFTAYKPPPTDVFYVGGTALCIPVGFILAALSAGPGAKSAIGGLAGFLLVCWGCGTNVAYSLGLCVLAHTCTIVMPVSFLPAAAHLLCWTYLLFFRLQHIYFGLPDAGGAANAVQLIMTLRVISVMVDIADGGVKRQPRLHKFIEYCYFFPGLVTGPVIRWCDYEAMICQQQRQDPANEGESYSFKCCKRGPTVPWARVVKCVAGAAFWGALTVVNGKMFPTRRLMEHGFLTDEPVWYRVGYLLLETHQHRWRFYVPWLLAEASLLVMIGTSVAYPSHADPLLGPKADPAERRPTHIARNVDPSDIELAPSCSHLTRFWNRSVQRWLVRYIFLRLGRASRHVATFAVSAYWHGVSGGLYLFFLQAPLLVWVETMLFNSSLLQAYPRVRWWTGWVLQSLMQCYMLPAFYLKDLMPTINLWRSLWWVGHWAALVLAAAAWLNPSKAKVEAKRA